MSMETWKEEFYPIAANSEMTDREAIGHSLNKWTGLLKKNLKRHGMLAEPYNHIIREKDVTYSCLEIDCTSCALCAKHLNNFETCGDYPLWTCGDCPLRRFLGHDCDYQSAEHNISPFSAWADAGNAMPMIRALRKTMDMVDKETPS